MKRFSKALTILLISMLVICLSGFLVGCGNQQAERPQTTSSSDSDSSFADDLSSSDSSSADSEALEEEARQKALSELVFVSSKESIEFEEEDTLVLNNALDEQIPLQGISLKEGGEAEFCGPLREDKVIALWTDTEISEEFGDYISCTWHLGAFDSTGKQVCSFDESLANIGIAAVVEKGHKYLPSVQNIPYYQEGLVVIEFRTALNQEYVLACFDAKGNLVWSKNLKNLLKDEYKRTQYECGYFKSSYATLLDKTGDIAYGEDSFSFPGKLSNLYSINIVNNDTFVIDDGIQDALIKGATDVLMRGGTHSVDPEIDTNLDGLFVSGIISISPSDAVVLMLTKVNPNGSGNNLRFYGIYSLAKDDWLLEPVKENNYVSGACFAGQKLIVIPAVDGKGACVVDAEGNVYLSAEEIKDNNLNVNSARDMVYIDDGWWRISNNFCKLTEEGLQEIQKRDKSMKSSPNIDFYKSTL